MASTAAIPDRILWAVHTLAIEPSDRLLEIGCGNGAAVSLIGDKLETGTITAIDQSVKMIRSAESNNAAHLAAGKAAFLPAALHEADFTQPGRFDKIFAVNVNLFWTGEAGRELASIRNHMAPQGRLYLFNQPPAAARIPHIADRTTRNLAAAGFTVIDVLTGDHKPVPTVCVIADAGAGPNNRA